MGIIEIIGVIVSVLLAGSWFRGSHYRDKAKQSDVLAEHERKERKAVENTLKHERAVTTIKEKQRESISETVGNGSKRVDLGVYEHGDRVHHD